MSENMTEFTAKLNDLVKYAQKNNNTLEKDDVLKFLTQTGLDNEQADSVYAYLEKQGIDIKNLFKV